MKKIFKICISFVIVIGIFFLMSKAGYINRLRIKMGWGGEVAMNQYILKGWQKSLAAVDSEIVFFGDSITCGGDWNTYFPEKVITNISVPGDSIEGLRNRVSLVEEVEPEKIFILAGINNLSRGHWKETVNKQYRLLLEDLKDLNAEIYIQSILPNRSPSKIENERIREANEIVKEIANEYGYTYIDLYTHFCDDNGELIKEYSEDGVHITEKAYEKWVESIRKYIE